MTPDRHVFGTPLRAKRVTVPEDLRDGWIQLSDETLIQYRRALPNAWADAFGPVETALAYLGTVRDRIDECLIELQRALT